jgi:3-methyladenine DNA glycosylase AlkD
MNAPAKLKQQLLSLANPEYAQHAQRFFKTGPGEYAEGDIFLGIRVPALRQLAKHYTDLTLRQLQGLIKSKFHEQRLFVLIVLVLQNKSADPVTQKDICDFYLHNTHYINNWDLVDTSASSILGSWLYMRDRKILFRLAKSENLWERRIAIVACHYFIKQNDFADALEIYAGLLHDKHDLIHKSIGWMLREIGKQNIAAEQRFLDQYADIMPRTMLRYSLEKFPARLKKEYMAAKYRSTVGKG